MKQKKLKTYLSIVQGNRWPVYFWFSYDEFVGFYIWLTLLILRSIYNLSINQKGTHQACVKAHYNIFLEIFSNSTFPENSQPFIWTFVFSMGLASCWLVFVVLCCKIKYSMYCNCTVGCHILSTMTALCTVLIIYVNNCELHLLRELRAVASIISFIHSTLC